MGIGTAELFRRLGDERIWIQGLLDNLRNIRTNKRNVSTITFATDAGKLSANDVAAWTEGKNPTWTALIVWFKWSDYKAAQQDDWRPDADVVQARVAAACGRLTPRLIESGLHTEDRDLIRRHAEGLAREIMSDVMACEDEIADAIEAGIRRFAEAVAE